MGYPFRFSRFTEDRVPTIVKGKLGSNLLVGSPDGSIFIYNEDGHYTANGQGRIAGDPGHPGLTQLFSTSGYAGSQDIFQGVAGVHNVLRMGVGHQALFLSNSGIPAPAPGPRLVNIDEIVCGAGGQIVDLTTQSFSYGSVKIRGGSGDDLLAGNAGNDTINGGLGNDFGWGGSGNDLINSGSGNDISLGADGADSIFGWAGNDSIDGGAGKDSLYGGLGDDLVLGSDGDDLIFGRPGADKVDGGAGNDVLYGGFDNDTVLGGDGNDTLYGVTGDDSLDGGAGDDTINGGAGNDTLVGGTGNNILIGGEGTNHLTAAAGLGKDVFGLAPLMRGSDVIDGFSQVDGDVLQVRLSDFAIPLVAATSSQGGSTLLIGAGLASVTYGTIANANGTFDIAKIALNTDGIIHAATPLISAAATATHAQFIYTDNASSGSLWFDPDGSGRGAAVHVADFAPQAGNGIVFAGEQMLHASDFLLVNA
jgi:Ca2+-binding RTX toxin-like protein